VGAMQKQPAVEAKSTDIAVVGMSCRFPGADNPDEFWNNLRDGKESIEAVKEEVLLANGLDRGLLENPHYVKAGSFLDGVEMFDPAFFGFSPRDASIMDPQHRLFLECASDVLEYAGYDPQRFPGAIGVFGGCGMNLYLVRNLLMNPEVMDSVGFWLVRHLGNDKDFLTTRVSYCLDLKGPSINVQTACSTSLVAIHVACQSLLNGECDLALAGGVTIEIPHRQGYLYQEGEILSPDGHCRAFDHRARGTVLGSGVGIVALRRLDDALASRDTIHAVVKASAINNDGAGKAGFFAPSVDGHAQVVQEALGIAEIEPESVTYVESHGTGTAVGDPIEIRALTEAFRKGTARTQFCGIGSVKTNIGHLDMAAGVASFIKVVESLKHKQIPPSLHFEKPNPIIDFENSPFFVVDRLCEWKSDGPRRRAGVSSLGVGGTNAHAILEEAPEPLERTRSRPTQLLVLCAKSEAALDTMSRNLATRFRERPDTDVADAAYTLQVGRRVYDHRRAVLCTSGEDFVGALKSLDPKRVFTASPNGKDLPVSFMFTGQGSQHVGMAAQLYSTEPRFREELDRCCELLEPHVNMDLLGILFPSEGEKEKATEQLAQTAFTQPALFAVEYALAKLWMSWGVRPQAMIGHSIGEYTAACLAGVFALDQALPLVALRGQLMQQLPRGLMVAVSLAEKEVRALLTGIEGACIAVQNAPAQFVISGTAEAVEQFEKRLAADFIPRQRLHTSHAFHSPMMDPLLGRFTDAVARVQRQAPQIPFISNLTGTWITSEEARDPAYWARHLRHTVRFGDGLRTLLNELPGVFLEVGPGKTLTTIARQHPGSLGHPLVLQSLPHPKEEGGELDCVLRALGQLWVNGVSVDWDSFNKDQGCRRLPLPTYPFERQRCWVEPLPASPGARAPQKAAEVSDDIDDWFWRPVWMRSTSLAPLQGPPYGNWLVLVDDSAFGATFVEWLRELSSSETRDRSLGLVVRESGNLASLSLIAQDRRPPADHEVEIHVHSAGLNFRDVLIGLGVYPDGPVPLGSECVGTVVAAGKNVTELRPGDEVVAIAQDTFRTFVTLDANFVVRKPRRLSFEQAATIPVTYMTAHYALAHVAQLSKGERVLIHAAAGGVGMAAVKLAQAVGAHVFATAGSDEKRAFLKSIGVEHVFDSRSFDFVDDIMDLTNNEGVDVVLNSLSGEFIPKSLSLLRPFGRFLEIGKADIYQGNQLGLMPFKKGLSFNSIDMEIVARDRPVLYRQLFTSIVAQFDDGRLDPLPLRVFSHRQAAQAFEFMAKAKHVGKVVLNFKEQPPSVVAVRAGRGYERIDALQYVVDPAKRQDYTRLLEDMGYAGEEPLRIAHLWSLGDYRGQNDRLTVSDQALNLSFYSLLYLTQAVSERNADQPVKLLAVSNRMQGVVAGDDIDPVKATLLGPIRVIPRELPNIGCRSVDIDLDRFTVTEPATFAKLVAELEIEDAAPVVAYRRGDRYVQSLEQMRPHEELTAKLRQGGVYLITGGLGGIGLVLAGYLADRFKAKLVLTGRTVLPPRSHWSDSVERGAAAPIIEQLERMESSGAELMIVSADVTDSVEMKAVVAAARDRFGTVHGVIHAAGVLLDGAVQLKQPEVAAQVLAPKVQGTLVLHSVLSEFALDFIVLLSSTSAVLGLAGQVDYTAANAFLNAFAASLRSSNTPVVAIGWGPWLEVGMAARMTGKASARPAASSGRPTDYPFLDACVKETLDEIVYRTEYRLVDHWVVNEHQIDGFGALMPGTGYLEIARACFERHAPDDCVEIRDVLFMAPFRVGADDRPELNISLEPADDSYTFRVSSQDSSGRVIDHAQGAIHRLSARARSGGSLREIRDRCNISSNGHASNPHFRFGPRWSNLKRVHFGRGEALATLELPERFVDDLGKVKLHPALLDIATSCALPLLKDFDPRTEFYVPVSCSSLKIYQSLPQTLYSHLRLRHESHEKEFATFDVTILNGQGMELVTIEEFTFRRATNTSLSSSARSDVNRPGAAQTVRDRRTPASNPAVTGIPPDRGVKAFERVLTSFSGEPEIIISPWSLRDPAQRSIGSGTVGIEETRKTAPAERSRALSPDRAGRVPHDDIEQVISSIWQGILGIENLGLSDNFFETGADSLSALRALTQIKRQLKASLSVPALYEHPTVQKLASLIREQHTS
jgi:acyl transferase domain-containing protein/NADPH:quinone reductase-like Zn-dependent oxidoreductase/NADP-dependent 3-hydroxy acid dehydrogenase YdfG